jgi:zinc transport system substrate-binding protein
MLGYVLRCRSRSARSKYTAALGGATGFTAVAASVAMVAGSLPGLSAVAAAPAARPRRAQPEVVASAYALAQLTSYIAGKDVHVVDLAPPGAQPEGLRLTPSGRATIGRAALVIDVGDGYQPEVEAAAKTARHHLSVLPEVSKQAQPFEFWLDPFLMSKAAALIAKELIIVDPAGRRTFEDGSRNFQSVAVSIESDFESTFSDCTRTEFVTADGAFERLAASFDLMDVSVDATGVKKAADIVRQDSLPTVFSETGVPSASLQQVARSTGARVASLNPLELAPAAGGPAPLSYFAVMEYDLTALEGPLACDITGGI